MTKRDEIITAGLIMAACMFVFVLFVLVLVTP